MTAPSTPTPAQIKALRRSIFAAARKGVNEHLRWNLTDAQEWYWESRGKVRSVKGRWIGAEVRLIRKLCLDGINLMERERK